MPRARQRNTATAQIGVLISEDAKAELDARAAADGLSLSHYCARILTAALASEEAA